MVTENHYRWDFIGLSTDSKPTPATSEKVVDGSTFYCADNSKLYVFCGDQWYEKEAQGGGGGDLPIASADTLGGVKVGDNLAIDSETGVLSGNYSSFTGTDGETGGSTGLVPAPATTDAGKFLKADGTWSSAGGVTIVQTDGTSTTDVMSQNAVTSMIYPDPSIKRRVAIGGSSSATADFATAIGNGAEAKATGATALGSGSSTSKNNSVALGRWSYCNYAGEVNVGTGVHPTAGYNSTPYRLISGVYDGQGLHDAATVAQGNTLATTAPTTATVGVLGQLYTDTTNMHTYQCTAIDDTDPANILYTWTQRW